MPDRVKEKLVELLREVQYLGGLEEKIADHLIANGVTVQSAEDINVLSKWISVKDRLPEDTCNVIAHCLSGCICSILYIKNIGFEDAGMRVFVTHWMPLPQPPKG